MNFINNSQTSFAAPSMLAPHHTNNQAGVFTGVSWPTTTMSTNNVFCSSNPNFGTAASPYLQMNQPTFQDQALTTTTCTSSRKRTHSGMEFGFHSETELWLRHQPSGEEPPNTFIRGNDSIRVPGNRSEERNYSWVCRREKADIRDMGWSNNDYLDADMIDVEGVDCDDLMEVEFSY